MLVVAPHPFWGVAGCIVDSLVYTTGRRCIVQANPRLDEVDTITWCNVRFAPGIPRPATVVCYDGLERHWRKGILGNRCSCNAAITIAKRCRKDGHLGEALPFHVAVCGRLLRQYLANRTTRWHSATRKGKTKLRGAIARNGHIGRAWLSAISHINRCVGAILAFGPSSALLPLDALLALWAWLTSITLFALEVGVGNEVLPGCFASVAPLDVERALLELDGSAIGTRWTSLALWTLWTGLAWLAWLPLWPSVSLVTLRAGHTSFSLCTRCTRYTLLTLSASVTLRASIALVALFTIFAVFAIFARFAFITFGTWFAFFALSGRCTVFAIGPVYTVLTVGTISAVCAILASCTTSTIAAACTICTITAIGTVCTSFATRTSLTARTLLAFCPAQVLHRGNILPRAIHKLPLDLPIMLAQAHLVWPHTLEATIVAPWPPPPKQYNDD